MQAKSSTLERTNTCELVNLPPHIKSICCRWIYKIKLRVNGSTRRFKVRMISKGYNQIKGLNYFDTYSHVAKLIIIKLVIALTTIKNWFIHQLYVNNIFLHGELQEDIYMFGPPYITPSKLNKVCKLIKYLYGLKQTRLKWYERLTSLLFTH